MRTFKNQMLTSVKGETHELYFIKMYVILLLMITCLNTQYILIHYVQSLHQILKALELPVHRVTLLYFRKKNRVPEEWEEGKGHCCE